MEISLSGLKKTILDFIVRFHVVIFTVIILGGLATVVLLLNAIVESSSDSSDYVPTGNSANFDQATIDRVNQLKSRDESSEELDLPEGRINPFVE